MEKSTMGRKRIENKKQKLTLTVDPDIIKKLQKMGVNKSMFFTDKAKELIYEKECKQDK